MAQLWASEVAIVEGHFREAHPCGPPFGRLRLVWPSEQLDCFSAVCLEFHPSFWG